MAESANDTFEVRCKREKNWFWLDNEVIDTVAKDVGHCALSVYVCLCRFADVGTQKCWPSVSTIQERLRMGRTQIMESLELLQTKHLITFERKNGKGSPNIYTILNLENYQSGSETTPVSMQDYPSPDAGRGVVSHRDAKEDLSKVDSLKEDLGTKPLRGKKEKANAFIEGKAALREEKRIEKLLNLNQDIIEWMKSTANSYGHKHWRLTGHAGGKGNRYQGPTTSMEEAIHDKENTWPANLLRKAWIKFLDDPRSDNLRFPFRDFLDGYAEKTLTAYYDERDRIEGAKQRAELDQKFAERNNESFI